MKHIAILRHPFFDMIVSGEKTIESRFTMSRRLPYKQISVGDTIFFKETGKPVTVRAEVEKVEFYELTPEIVEEIRKKYGKQIGTDKFEDWEETRKKKYCTLVWICNVTKIPPMEVLEAMERVGFCLMKNNFIFNNRKK